MRFINLILAGVWAAVGVLLLVPSLLFPGQGTVNVPGTSLPLGSIAFVLAAYNVVRWWTQRDQSRRLREMDQWLARMHRRPRRSEAPTEPDPNFMFTDQPPGPPPVK